MSEDYENTQIARIVAALYPDGDAPDSSHDNVKTLSIGDRNIIPVFSRCLTTGTEAAQERAQEIIKGMLNFLHESQKPEFDLDDLEDYDLVAHPRPVINVLRAWNMTNVLMEVNDTQDGWDACYDLSVLETTCPELDPTNYDYSSDVFWRGVAAITRTRLDPASDVTADFINYAGTHSDILKVIDVAKQRNTLNVDTISGLIEVQEGTALPLHNGTL